MKYQKTILLMVPPYVTCLSSRDILKTICIHMVDDRRRMYYGHHSMTSWYERNTMWISCHKSLQMTKLLGCMTVKTHSLLCVIVIQLPRRSMGMPGSIEVIYLKGYLESLLIRDYLFLRQHIAKKYTGRGGELLQMPQNSKYNKRNQNNKTLWNRPNEWSGPIDGSHKGIFVRAIRWSACFETFITRWSHNMKICTKSNCIETTIESLQSCILCILRQRPVDTKEHCFTRVKRAWRCR